MAKKRGDPDYLRRQTACISLGKRIWEKSGFVRKTKLEAPLGFTEAHGSNFGKFASGKQVPSHERIIKIASLAFDHGWLTHEELQEIGFLESPFDKLKYKNKTLPERLDLAVEKFERCMSHMRAGLLPYPFPGPNGMEFRPPKDAAELLKERQKLIADIESLGGEVRYLPYMRRPTKKDLSQRVFEGADFPNWQLFLEWREGDFCNALAREEYEKRYEGFYPDEYDSWQSYEAAVDAAEAERMRTQVFDPAEYVTDLYLWFGGRDYSHPYRLIEEDEVSPFFKYGVTGESLYGDMEWECAAQSDDLREFFKRKEQRDAARSLTPGVLAQTTSADWRKSGAPASNPMQWVKHPCNAKPL